MFDIGWAELLVIGVVAIILVKPEDLPAIFKGLRKFLSKFQKIRQEVTNIISEVDQEVGISKVKKDIEKKIILDLDGNPQEAYSLDDIRPDIIEKEEKK